MLHKIDVNFYFIPKGIKFTRGFFLFIMIYSLLSQIIEWYLGIILIDGCIKTLTKSEMLRYLGLILKTHISCFKFYNIFETWGELRL